MISIYVAYCHEAAKQDYLCKLLWQRNIFICSCKDQRFCPRMQGTVKSCFVKLFVANLRLFWPPHQHAELQNELPSYLIWKLISANEKERKSYFSQNNRNRG